MCSVNPPTNRSSENLRIVSQPILQRLQVAKSLRLTAPSALSTPPLTPCANKRSRSETLLDGTHLTTGVQSKEEELCTPTLLPQPNWASDTREPVKRPPIQGIFALLTPSPSPHGLDSHGKSSGTITAHGETTEAPVLPSCLGVSAAGSSEPRKSHVSRPRMQRFPRLRLSTPYVDGSHESPGSDRSRKSSSSEPDEPTRVP